ncbi:MAG: esterase family protein [Bacteroidales bacterium]|nr:esterase family protein [Bacteroidales bacterium]
MNIEYHKWYSERLGRDMELKVYGHSGKPFIIFPCQGGRFFESEDFGMIDAISYLINDGRVKVFTVDGIDNESWANYGIHPADRAVRHNQYDSYVMNEVVPFIRSHCQSPDIKIALTGFSMGAYHAANFYFRHPYIFDVTIAISGLYDMKMFLGDYMDDNVYYNSPINFLGNMQDEVILNQYRQGKIVICTGQGAWEEEMLEDTYQMKAILEQKQIPALIDIWGHDVNHDWPWWKKMLPHFIEKLGF